MGYALAHDENGVPLDVPTSASGWLVRKHSGGRGRPAAVYDPDGRPLVVLLDATTADLRDHGCKPGMYRLDAVDSGRKPMGITAYTELQASADDPPEVTPGGGPDAAVAALARAVEAMQRVQAERERMQAQMFMRLIDRMAPAPVPTQTANDMPAMVRQLAETQEALQEMAEAGTQRNAAPEVDDDPPETVGESPAVVQTAEVVAKAGLPLLSQWLWKKLGLSDNQVEEMAAAAAAVGQKTQAAAEAHGAAKAGETQGAASETQDATSEAQGAAAATEEQGAAKQQTTPPDDVGESEVARKLTLVLTPEEQKRAQLAVKMLPPNLLAQIEAKLLSMKPADAANYLRSIDAKFGGAVPQAEKGAA